MSGNGKATIKAMLEAQEGKKDSSWNGARSRMVDPQSGGRKELLRELLERGEEARKTEAAVYTPGLFRYLAPRMTPRPGVSHHHGHS